MLDGWYLCVPCTLYNGTCLTWGVMSALNMQSSDIYVLLVFLAFAPSFWEECEMKSLTANTCIPSHQVSSRFSRICAIKMKRQICIFFIPLFPLPKRNVCVMILLWLDRKTPRPGGQQWYDGASAFSHSLLVYHPPPNLSVCASTRLQTSVFPPGWLQGRRLCRPIIN